MGKSFARAVGTLAVVAATAAAAVVTAAPATAAGTIITTPRLTVVCAAPHHGLFYSAVRFEQHGHWAGGAHVVATVTYADSNHTKVEMHTKAGPHGWFRLHRTLLSSETGPWVVGTTYTWTTALYKKTAATARRGTVKLVNTC